MPCIGMLKIQHQLLQLFITQNTDRVSLKSVELKESLLEPCVTNNKFKEKNKFLFICHSITLAVFKAHVVHSC